MPLAPPAFQFYPADFLVSTTTMSNREVGAYIRLLCHQWVNGGIPFDAQIVSKIVQESVPRTRGVLDALRSKFVLDHTGQLKNPRLERTREKTLAFSAIQRAKGQRGGRPRKKSRGFTEKKPARLSSGKPLLSSISDLRSVRTYKNAAAPHAPPVETVEKSQTHRDRPVVRVLAAMVLEDLLPKGIPDDGELVAAAKQRAADLHLKYDGRSIAAAIASAQAQHAKRGNGHL